MQLSNHLDAQPTNKAQARYASSPKVCERACQAYGGVCNHMTAGNQCDKADLTYLVGVACSAITAFDRRQKFAVSIEI